MNIQTLIIAAVVSGVVSFTITVAIQEAFYRRIHNRSFVRTAWRLYRTGRIDP